MKLEHVKDGIHVVDHVASDHPSNGAHGGSGAHDKHAGHDPEVFRRRFWLTLLISIPVVVISEMIMDWFGYGLDGVGWVGPVLGTFVYVWGGWPFLAGAINEIRDRAPGMMLLIAMAITVAWGSSMASSIGWLDLEFWWELAALVTIMLLGHWQEMKAIGQARGALDALAALLPDDAEVLDNAQTTIVRIVDLQAGQLVLVRAGARVPADGTAVSARNGILVKDRLALERMRTVTAVLFDKTGTLTEGRHVVTGVAGAGITDHEVLRLAGGVELDSEHPLARAIVTAARGAGSIATATEFKAITGRGVEALIDGTRYAVGGPVLLRQRSLTIPDSIRQSIDDWTSRGAAVLHLVRGDQIIGAFALEDKIRPEARQAVIDLHNIGIERVVMITGDAQQVADAVAAELGIDEVFAEVLPEDKQAKVAELQARGLRVAMVGDGVNDAPALAKADVGLAIGAGTDVAIESAGVVLAGNDPRAVTGVIRLSRASYRKMRQNLVWAAGYNIVAIPLAAGAFAWAGITLPPAVGAILMSLSTIVVALNAQLLRRVELS